MKTKSTLRKLVIAVGTVQFILFAVSGFTESSFLIGGIILSFIGATNFCSQCPLLAAITGHFRRQKQKRIHIDRL